MNSDKRARKYSKDFERLAVAYLAEQLKLEPEQIVVTQASKDGGFDGELRHVLFDDGAFSIDHTTLVEAKLRTRSPLETEAVAKLLLIGFCGRAQTMVVATNVRHGPQAEALSEEFTRKTNLYVRLINGEDIVAWLDTLGEHGRHRFPEGLISFLHDSRSSQPRSEHGAVAPRTSALHEAPEVRVRPPVVSSPDPGGNAVDTIVGKKRRQLFHQLRSELRRQVGVAIVSGEPGVGKSHFAGCLRREAASDGMFVHRFDLQDWYSVRHLFTAVIEELTGLSLPLIMRSERPPYMQAPDDLVDAVLQVLRESAQGAQRVTDLDTSLLLQYLSIVLSRRSEQKRLFVFENLDKSTPAILEFTTAMMSTLTSSGVSTLIELRRDHDPSSFPEQAWSAWVKHLEGRATIGVFRVEELTDEDATEFVQELLPGLGPERAETVRSRVGNVPLMLETAAGWVRTEGVVGSEGGAYFTVDKLGTFMHGISPGDAVTLLDRFLASLWKAGAQGLADVICASVLCGHSIPYLAFDTLFGEDTERVTEWCQEIGLLRPGLHPASLHVKHVLMSERMEALCAHKHFRMKRVAEMLLPIVDRLGSRAPDIDVIRVRLLLAMGDWRAASGVALCVASTFRAEMQWDSSLAMYVHARDALEKLAPDDQAGRMATVALLEQLEVERARDRLAEDRCTRLRGMLRTRIVTDPGLPDRDEHRVRALLIDWRAEFLAERLDVALSVSDEVREAMLSVGEGAIGPALRASALSCRGVTLKAMGRTAESAGAFAEAERLEPDNMHLRIAGLSNAAALAITSDPQQALANFEQILSIHDALRTRLYERLHSDIDLAMGRFLVGHYNGATEVASLALKSAEPNGIPLQAARAMNIMGVDALRRQDFDTALVLLDRAAFACERAAAYRFLWRIRANQTLCASLRGDANATRSLAKSTLDLVLPPREDAIRNADTPESLLKHRWYAAILMSFDCGLADDSEGYFQSLLRKYEQTAVGTHLAIRQHPDGIASLFESGSLVHDGLVLITG